MMGPTILGQLLDKHAAALTLYARQRCAAPEDVVQEAFIKLIAQKKPPQSIVPWLYRVVRNGAISAARSAQRRRRHEAAAACLVSAWFSPPESPGLDPETAAAALLELPLEQREVIVAHLWGGLTFLEIGELIGASNSSAHRLYIAGLSALRERLGVSCPQKRTIQN